MKKLRIKNKRQFKKAILTIIMSIAIIIAIVLFFNNLKTNGLEELFTTNAYKEAFREQTKTDIAIINMLMGITIGIVITTAINLLLEYESEEQEDYELNEILKRNGVDVDV